MATIITVNEWRFPDRVRLPLHFDAARLAADLAAFDADEWIEHFVRQNYDGDWSVLPLRSAASATHPVMMIYSSPTETEFVDTPFLARTPYFAEVLSQFECPLTSVRLMRLTPGSVILEHHDPDLAAEHGTVRIHVPVMTNPGVEFLVNRTPVTMLPGEAWYLRLLDPHSVANRGETDRVHLVIDAKMNDWLEAILTAG
ncbi:aspartyl/asparaginyl beta-hydroxylase domain-containing protein [Sphingomonas sp. HF-S3]|uniref:Aspartyl/asparaginyl beta-hydroxylase domain-containing protein n=1 Tax=Sphingomonas rustica TaxID=3103142 RepID=A0ABV0B999_9SPHN